MRTQTIHQRATAESGVGSHAGFLQRACACGGSSGLSGTCEECEKKKLIGMSAQAKLRINEPGDQYEQEADRVAEQVMRMPIDGAAPSQRSSDQLIQRRLSGAGGLLSRAAAEEPADRKSVV